ncbi:MAG: LysR family transcriptional regulator, partial [Hyphomicrobiales bacterium]|nr:LysR family transcriptional regulator [Hyphomicrobiales bacterium]
MATPVPLASLRAFEAAGRTGSFRAAAEELALSPSAVSHAIRKLETSLGVPLFERGAR